MSRLLLNLQYRFYKVNAYLAAMMGDHDCADEMLSIANEAQRLWVRESIQ